MSASSTDTYDQVGIREDLINAIYNVDPTETPFVSGVGRTRAAQTLHEWQTDTYAAVADNKAVEGADASFAPASPTVRLNNITQVSQKTVMISGTLEATDRAGRDKEMNYQLLKRGVELKRDMENACVGLNNAKVTGNATTARELGSVLSYIATNDDFGATGASPTGDGSDARTDGTQRAFTETLLGNVIDLCWNSGGKPNKIMVGSFNKRTMNGFTGRAASVAQVNTEAVSKQIINSVDVYVSDYGNLEIIANRYSRARDALVLQMDMWALAFLRNMTTEDIARTGDAEKKQILVEYTLESKNEKASGLVADLLTS